MSTDLGAIHNCYDNTADPSGSVHQYLSQVFQQEKCYEFASICNKSTNTVTGLTASLHQKYTKAIVVGERLIVDQLFSTAMRLHNRLKVTITMKKALKILGIVLGVVALLIGIAAIYNSSAALPTYTVPAPDIQVELDSTRIARGAKIVNGTCTFCHQGKADRLDGRLFVDDPGLGKVFSSNITQDKEVGIGNYTDGELVRLLRTGIKKNGRLALPMMAKMPHLSDEDVYGIIAYLRSDAPELAPTPTAQPEPAMGFVGKALSRLVFEPLPMPDSPIPHPDMKDRVAYGKYLMTDAMECANCHSASFETYDIVNPEQSEGFLGGGNVVELHGLGKLLSPNITMHPEKGIGKMTVEDFIQIVKYRQHPSGREINPIMPNYNSYSEDDIRAVWEYIQTVPVSDNDVSALTEKLAAN